MKRRDLLLSLCLLTGSYAFAVDSPYTGAPAAEGTYYLYQVETGKWLQTNRKNFEVWTTHAALDDVGMDVQLKKLEGFEGYQIFCNFTANGELNGSDEDRFYLDQADRDLTDWIFVPVEGTENQYKIMVKAKPDANDRSKIANDTYIGADADGELSDNPANFTWQLVTRAERIEKMIAEAKKGTPADATFLIPWNDLGRNDMRDRLWTQTVVNNFGGGNGFGGANGYPVKEAWHRMNVRSTITLTDLPTGTYNFTVQAYYRDTEIESDALRDRYVAGTEYLRAKYFAGAAEGTVMSIFADAKDAAQDGYTFRVPLTGSVVPAEGEEAPGDDVPSKWVPNSMGDAAGAMFNGAYINKWIQAPVTDGKLTIGIEKSESDESCHRDWLIYKRFYLQFVSETPIAEDLSGLRTELQELINTGKGLTQTPTFVEAIAAAEDALANATSSSTLLEVISDLKSKVNALKDSQTDIYNFNATLDIVKGEGVDVAEAVDKYNTAVTRDDFSGALRTLRYARRRNAADRQEDVFKGQPVAVGNYYLYNVGQKQFLCGGSDWGAHAALGFPGVEITLEADDAEAAEGKFHINTHLNNGGEKNYLGYAGYMDSDKAGAWQFVKVEGKENVYNIVQADYPDAYVVWDPYATTDMGNNDETTVNSQCRSPKLDAENLDAQWRLVTREERAAMLEEASIDNPVDATIFIKSPNFSQREGADNAWDLSNASIWEYGSNHYDFAAESWNTESCSINQMVENMPQGVYVASAQGFYRNGNHADQPNLEPLENAIFYAGLLDEINLPNIMSESYNAPGEGNNAVAEDGTEYQYPDGIVQATNFFHSGLYRVKLTFLKDTDEDMPLGIEKKTKGEEGDWVVVDNFRLTYYGNNTTVEDVENVLSTGINAVKEQPAVKVDDNRIYNMQGLQVKNATKPGLYIKNGKKFVVK